jgi:hypothetical protein
VRLITRGRIHPVNVYKDNSGDYAYVPRLREVGLLDECARALMGKSPGITLYQLRLSDAIIVTTFQKT